MKIIRSEIFKQFPELVFGFSTKIGLDREPPFHFNMSLSVGDENENVLENRKEFYTQLGLNENQIAFQKQIHSDIICSTIEAGQCGESDALITNKINLGLAVSSADCANIFIYNKKENVIAAVHSGWKGTRDKILSKTLDRLRDEFDCETKNNFVFVGPSIEARNYEVGKEFENYFEQMYLSPQKEKYLLDVKKINYDILINSGIPDKQIEVCTLCSFEEDYLHSYRREGARSGRAWGILAIKD